MSGARSVYLPVLGHEMHVTEWGDPAGEAVVLWHGLARTGRDFDALAERLAGRYFVLCPDTIGRGLSTWSDNPEVEYDPAFYARMALEMLDRYGIERAHWLGTSMGGLIGMHVAAKAPERLRTLVINDIGPEVPAAAVERIVTYAADLPVFERVSEAEDWLRRVYLPFGPAPDGFWRRMAESSVRRKGDGQLTLHYDARVIDMIARRPETLEAWDLWDAIATPCHVFRGARSDLLTEDVLARMVARGPRPEVSVFPECGHAPALASTEDAALVAGLFVSLGRD